MVAVAEELNDIKIKTGKTLHLDIEPEPDGILENSFEFISWFNDWLLPVGIEMMALKGISAEIAEKILRTHIQLCYDVCHFAVGYEEPETVIRKFESENIKIGKIQISSALKVDLTSDAAEKVKALAGFDEPSYLHQVVARKSDGKFESYKDLNEAIADFEENKHEEWRVHFHVPLFIENYGSLASTQSEIIKTLTVQRNTPFTEHMEVETYTWGVLPSEVQAPLNDSIVREMQYVKQLL